LQPLGQLLQQPALAGQLQPAGPRPTREPIDQLLIQRVKASGRRRRSLAADRVQVHRFFGDHVSQWLSFMPRGGRGAGSTVSLWFMLRPRRIRAV
jgi:hypothetical protein